MLNEAYHTTAFKTPRAREAAAARPDEERDWMIRNLLVPYPGFRKGTKLLERFHMSQKLGRARTGSIGGVIGEFRSGKSVLVKNYIQRFPRVQRDLGFETPVVYVVAYPDWDAKSVGTDIARKLGRPLKGNLKVNDVNDAALSLCQDQESKLIVIDNAHFLIAKGGSTAASLFGFVKEAVETRTANVLLMGPGLVRTAIRQRKEYWFRGGFPHAKVDPFDQKIADGRDNYYVFLEEVDFRLPFARMSGLALDPIASDLKAISGGSVGISMEIIKAAADIAFEENADFIHREHFVLAMDDRDFASETELTGSSDDA